MATPAATPEHHRQQRKAYGEVALLAVFWAFNWVGMKAILPHLSPLYFLTVRFFGAAVLVGMLVKATGAPLVPPKGERLWLAIVGILLNAGVMAPATVALQYLGAGRTTVLVYTMQLWALPLGWMLLKDRPTWRGALGGLVGFCGMILFLNPALVDWSNRTVLMGNLMVVSGAISWALGSCGYRTRKWQSPLWTQVLWQCLWSAVALAGLTWLLNAPLRIDWNLPVVGFLLFNWFVSTSIACWLWTRAITVLPVPKAGQVVSLVPVLAVTFSAVFMGERVSALAVVSIALILCGIIVTLRSR